MKKFNVMIGTVLFILLALTSNAYSLRVATLNTEWLWDTSEPHEGQIVGYDEGDIRPPNTREYVLETFAIAKTIESLDADIVGLTEIENENVAEEILKYLKDDWKVVFEKGRDTYTGQDVAILTRLDAISGTVTNFPDYNGESDDGRIKKRPSKVLGVGLKDGNETYFVVVTHLLSKRSSNDDKRYAQADAIRNAVIDQYGQYNHFIVMGDMNDLPGSDVLQKLKGERDDKTNLLQPASSSDYSYVYEGRKQLIDHILVSKDLAEGGTFWSVELPEAITDHRVVVFESN